MRLFIHVAGTRAPHCFSTSDARELGAMTLLRAAILVLIAIIGVTHAQNLSPRKISEPGEEIDVGYRPWEHNTSTTWISLEGMGIQTVTSKFRLRIPNLEWLVMDNNQIRTISSDAFEFFPELTYLSLVGNQINNLQISTLSHLDKLQVLDLDRNFMNGTVDETVFSRLAALKRLYLRNCQLSSFDLPVHMGNLSHLYLSRNLLAMFYVTNTSALTSLHLDVNQLWFVSLSQLKSLTYLNLKNNQLKRIVRRSEIPPAFYAKTVRRQYSYGYNGYSEDESGLFLDDGLALQHLIVSSNKLSKIESDTFLDTKALVHVDLTGNQISEVYAGTFNNLLQLEDILLDSNLISQINHRAFVNLPNLKTISLKNNQIDDVDEDAFTKLNSNANEVYLFLDENQIHTLRKGSFRGIKGLKHIGLSNNRIKTISSQAFVDLPNLDSIVIEDQLRDENFDGRPGWQHRAMPISVSRKGLIESDAFFNLTNITSITIRGNLFTDIEAQAFHELPKLTLLDLSNNSINTLSSEAFHDLPALENLYLGGNLISNIAPHTFPKQLKHLDLARNLVCPEFSCWHLEELHQLEELDVSGIIERFKIEDLTGFPENLTVIIGTPEAPSNSPVPCY